MDNCLVDTSEVIGLPCLSKGKVRDSYGIPGHPDKLLLVASDRISAYDVVMNEGVPGKGAVLTQMSLLWFNVLNDIPNHLITADVAKYLEGRSMLVKKLEMLPIECIVRGRMTGSYWKAYKEAPVKRTESEYASSKEVCGFSFETNMRENAVINPALFTPSTKAEQGLHDENISLEKMRELLDEGLADKVAQVSLQLYTRAVDYANERGIVIADTKFELGIDPEGNLCLGDEVLTPDSSRFWPKDKVELDKTPPSLDKQFLRDYLTETDWDKKSKPPTIPTHIIEQTSAKYQEAMLMLAL
jgi:phosphoribosylaminoimidazole-succinocarboxamide synthase